MTIDEQKSLKVWDVDRLDLLSSREIPKKANQLLITQDETILVADKFGDVFSYPMDAPEIPPPVPKPKNSLENRKSVASHSNPSLGTLIVGHTSSLLSMTLSRDERFLVTADRDEHIRVSHYPRGYNIERYCLGHTKYISAIHIHRHLPHLLISGGGDRALYFWDYLKGTLLHRLDVWEVVHGSTKVSSQRRKWKRIEVKRGEGWRARRKREREEKKRLKSQQSGQVEPANSDQGQQTQSPDRTYQDEVENEERDMIEDEEDHVGDSSERQEIGGGIIVSQARARLPSLEEVIAVSKIETLCFKSQYALLFSAFGSNGVFFVPCDANTGLPSQDSLFVHYFPAPILDIAVHTVKSHPREDPTEGPVSQIYVSIDTGFCAEEDAAGTPMSTRDPEMNNGATGVSREKTTSEVTTDIREVGGREHGIHLLEWRGGDMMVRVEPEASPLLAGLHRIPTISASAAEIRALDLYGALTALPKTEEIEGEDNEGEGVGMEGIEGTDGQQPPGSTTSKDNETPHKGLRKQARKKWADKMAEEARKRVGTEVNTPTISESALPAQSSEFIPTYSPSDANASAVNMSSTGTGVEVDGPGGSGIGTVRKGRDEMTDSGKTGRVDDGDDGDSGPATKRLKKEVDA